MTEIGTVTSTVQVTTENGTPLREVDVTLPVHAWAPIRLETWERDGRRVGVESDVNGQVLVSIDLFRKLLIDLGFQRIDE